MAAAATGRRAGDAWVECACGRRHWGLFGAAGLLLVRRTPAGGHEVALQHRAEWSDQGGTWGMPGGALDAGESPVAGALREAAEEAGVDPRHVEPVHTQVLDHGTWSYTTVVARATGPQHLRPTDAESLAIVWVPTERVAEHTLLRAFGDAWPGLRAVAEST